MARTNSPFGLQPWNTVLRAGMYAIVTANTTAVFIGDAVNHGGTSYTTKWGQLPGLADTATMAGAAGKTIGPVLGLFDHKGDPILYMPASTTGDGVIAGFALVADHPDQLFLVQEDSDSENIVAAEIGLNADMVVGSGSTKTGLSAAALDSSTEASTSTLMLKIVSLHPDDIIAPSDTTPAYNRFIVKINSHYFGSNISGI